MSGDMLFVLGVGLVAVVAWVLNWIPDEPSPPDMDRMTDSERLKALQRKQAAARVRMKQLGIRSLLDGHKGWQTVNPMADKRPTPDNLVELRAKR